MKHETLFLKATVFLIGIPIAVLSILWLPWLIGEFVEDYAAWVYLPIACGMYAATIPYFIALYQTFRLLNYIDKNKAFSELSVRSLMLIKYCAIAVSVLFAAIMPFVYVIAEKDDAPGMLAFGMVIVFASLVIAVFAAVLQKLLNKAIDIQSENDLTV